MPGTGREQHDTPSYEAMGPVGWRSDHDKPNSSINDSPGDFHDTAGEEAYDLMTSVMSKASDIVDQAELIVSISRLKAQADYDAFTKAKYSADDKRKMLAAGKAFKNANGDPSYPIGDTEDLSNAIRAVGRGGASHNAIRKYIMRRAKAMGKSSMIPESWSSDGTVAKELAKADGEADPGSPAWEQEDCDKLTACAQCLAECINDVQCVMERECAEVAAGEADDRFDVWDLQDAISALQYGLGVVARLAFHEGAAATAPEDDDAMAKSFTANAVDVMIQAVSFLKELHGSGRPAPEGSGESEEWDMALTKEDLAAAVGEGVGLALAKAEEDRLAREATAKEEADRLAKEAAAPEAKTEEPAPEAEPVAKGEEEPKPEPDLAELMKGVMTDALAPFSERLSALEGQPAAGGPLVGAGGAGNFKPGQRGASFDGNVPPEITRLKDRIQKAAADGDTLAETRYRKELGQKVLEVAWAGMGYPTTAARGRAPQYTESA
jgi:hypothetical protein